MSVGARLRKVVLSGFCGWLTGALLTTPFQIVEVARNAEGNLILLVETLGLGLTLWAIWTLVIAIIGVLGAGVPVAIWVKPAWLLEHRASIVAGSMGTGLVAVLWHFHMWEIFRPEPFADMPLVTMYGIFACVFAGVTALLYLRMLRDHRRPAGS